jgi:hypothetical protein
MGERHRIEASAWRIDKQCVVGQRLKRNFADKTNEQSCNCREQDPALVLTSVMTD